MENAVWGLGSNYIFLLQRGWRHLRGQGGGTTPTVSRFPSKTTAVLDHYTVRSALIRVVLRLYRDCVCLRRPGSAA